MKRRSRPPSVLAPFAVLALLTPLGCESGFEAPSRLTSLRVLAVRADPASGSPGVTSKLVMTVVDGGQSPEDAAERPRPLQIAWLGGCHNPPTRQYFACFPLLSRIASQLAPRVVDTPSLGVPPGIFATSMDFEIPVPSDILKAAPSMPGDPIHFGVSYAFFAVCAGELRPRPDYTNRVPLDCVDAESGAQRDHRDFVTGYTTLYTYEGASNLNPLFTGLRFNEVPLTVTPCTSDADCAGLVGAEAGFELACSRSRQCAPRVPRCAAKACRKFMVYPEIDTSSAEPMPNEATNEIVWSNFYATAGSFDTDTQLVNDPSIGWLADHGSYFQPPEQSVSGVSLWVTVHDQRGGTAVRTLELLISE